MPVLIRALQGHRTNMMYVYAERDFYKELAYVMVKAGKLKICMVGLQVGDPVEAVLQFESVGGLR